MFGPGQMQKPFEVDTGIVSFLIDSLVIGISFTLPQEISVIGKNSIELIKNTKLQIVGTRCW
jgi:hypothetical protein